MRKIVTLRRDEGLWVILVMSNRQWGVPSCGIEKSSSLEPRRSALWKDLLVFFPSQSWKRKYFKVRYKLSCGDRLRHSAVGSLAQKSKTGINILHGFQMNSWSKLTFVMNLYLWWWWSCCSCSKKTSEISDCGYTLISWLFWLWYFCGGFRLRSIAVSPTLFKADVHIVHVRLK